MSVTGSLQLPKPHGVNTHRARPAVVASMCTIIRPGLDLDTAGEHPLLVSVLLGLKTVQPQTSHVKTVETVAHLSEQVGRLIVGCDIGSGCGQTKAFRA